MWVKPGRRIFAHNFQSAASPKALKRIDREICRWTLHHRGAALPQARNPKAGEYS
jgi:hypothetical protein